MLKLGLLNADLETDDLPGIEDVRLFRLTGSEKKDFTAALPTLGVLVADLNLINTDSFGFLNEQSGTLAGRLREGALLVCFTSRPNLHSPDGVRNKYSWLPFFDDSKEVREDLVDKIRIGEQGNAVTEALGDLVGSFYATCSFPKGFGTELYEVVLCGEDGVPVGLMKAVDKGCVLLVPQAEDKRAVLERILGWWEKLLQGPDDRQVSKWAEESNPGIKALESKEESTERVPEVEVEASTESGEAGDDQGLAALPLDALTPDAPPSGADGEPAGSDPTPEASAANESVFEEEPIAIDETASLEAAPPETDEFSGDGGLPEPPEAAAEATDKYEGAADPFAVANDEVAEVFGGPSEPVGEKQETSSASDVEEGAFSDARDELDALLENSATDETPAPVEEQPSPEPEEDTVAAETNDEAVPHTARPEWLDEVKASFPFLSELSEEAASLEKQAQELLDKAAELRAKVDELSTWDALLYEPAARLAETVCEFFERVLGADTKLIDSDTGVPALRVLCEENDYLVHVATSPSPIAEDAGRELMRHLADADVDTKGLLIVNGALGAEPKDNPMQEIEDKLAKLARKRGLVIVSTGTLYRIGLAAQQEKGWKPDKVLQALAEQEGVFKTP